MKKIKFLLLSTFTLLITSCEKEEAYPLDTVDYKSQKNIRDYTDFPQLKPVKLKFKKLTEESKMGRFWNNKIVEFNGKLWSVGGFQNGVSYPNQSSEVWSSTDGYNWGLVTKNQFDARATHSLTVFDGKMWLIGGVSNSSTALSDVWFSSDGVQWTLATNTPDFGQIAWHSTTVFNNKLIVFWGNKVWQSSDGIDWELMAEDVFPIRFNSELTVFNDKLYLIGGSYINTYYNQIWQSGNGTDWSQVPTSPIFNGISWFSTANYKHKIWVIGGSNETGYASDEIWFSANMNDWHKYDGPVPLSGLSRHSSLVYQDRVLVFGGLVPSVGPSGSVWSFEEVN